jgi:hypothetical protein
MADAKLKEIRLQRIPVEKMDRLKAIANKHGYRDVNEMFRDWIDRTIENDAVDQAKLSELVLLKKEEMAELLRSNNEVKAEVGRLIELFISLYDLEN